jgi:hypothetical protein
MRIRLVVIFLFVGISVGYAQNHIEPFHTRNLSPLIHFFGIPNQNGGDVLQKKDFVFGNYLNIANNATLSRLQEETVYLDGEMYRNDIILRYGLFDKLEVELSVPLVRHSSGLMDPFITGWHNTFGLPAKGRDEMENYKLTYLYQENETTYVLMNEGKLDIGDIALRLTTPLLQNDKHLLSLSTFVKFSTGEKSQLIGSGTNDIGFNLSGRLLNDRADKGFTWFYSGGYMRIGSGAVLDDFLFPKLPTLQQHPTAQFHER